MATNEEIYNAVLHDDDLTHSGVMGMSWYKHRFGEWQNHAKYAAGRARYAGDNSPLNDVKKEAPSEREVRKQQKAENAARQLREKEAKKRAIEDQKKKEEHDQLIRDLATGKADWRKASSDDLNEAIERLTLEKQYKDLRDDVSGAKTLKKLGFTAADSVAKKAGDMLNSLISKSLENWQANVKFERKKVTDKYNDERQEKAEAKRKKEEAAEKIESDKKAASERAIKEAKDAATKAEKERKEAEAKADRERRESEAAKRISDLSRGEGDLRNASKADIQAATEKILAEAKLRNARETVYPTPKAEPLDVREEREANTWTPPSTSSSSHKKVTTDTTKARKKAEAASKERQAEMDYYLNNLTDKLSTERATAREKNQTTSTKNERDTSTKNPLFKNFKLFK